MGTQPHPDDRGRVDEAHDEAKAALASLTEALDNATVEKPVGRGIDLAMAQELTMAGHERVTISKAPDGPAAVERKAIPGESIWGMGAALIAAERNRQKVEEGYSPRHDQIHTPTDLAMAAAAYALASPQTWPWEPESFKLDGEPSIPTLRDLIRAGALLAAAIDRELS